MSIVTFPPQEMLEKYQRATPDYMHPNQVPFAVIAEGYFSPEVCNYIAKTFNQYEIDKHEKCGAVTREIGKHFLLKTIEDFAHFVNQTYWQYDLDQDSYTWMQTYSAGGNYQLHMDAGPGRMRKLTAVIFLTDPDEYTGGDLKIHFHPTWQWIPRTQGTIVLFQPWILHEVHEVTSGTRQTLNMSFWGPNFK